MRLWVRSRPHAQIWHSIGNTNIRSCSTVPASPCVGCPCWWIGDSYSFSSLPSFTVSRWVFWGWLHWPRVSVVPDCRCCLRFIQSSSCRWWGSPCSRISQHWGLWIIYTVFWSCCRWSQSNQGTASSWPGHRSTRNRPTTGSIVFRGVAGCTSVGFGCTWWCMGCRKCGGRVGLCWRRVLGAKSRFCIIRLKGEGVEVIWGRPY